MKVKGGGHYLRAVNDGAHTVSKIEYIAIQTYESIDSLLNPFGRKT